MPLTLASLTVARSDFGRMELLYRALHDSGRFRLSLAAGAAHHNRALGYSLTDVKRSALPVDYIVPAVEGGPGVQSAAVLSGVGAWLEERRPDALLILGDRFEMLAGAQAAMLARVPIIHVGGGHLTLGAMDERARHAISKLSALHLVASATCGQRVAALHEDPDTIHVTGAPELDALLNTPVSTRAVFCAEVGLDPSLPFILVTFHPETNVPDEVNAQFASEIDIALSALTQQILITAPCADPGNAPFLALCEGLQRRRKGVSYIPNLGLDRYVSALRHAELMLGNSSSGIIEAATVGLPVVNVGERQAMRDRAANVIDCAFDADAIVRSVTAATSPHFIALSRKSINPYGDGTFVIKALDILNNLAWPLPIDKPWGCAIAKTSLSR